MKKEILSTHQGAATGISDTFMGPMGRRRAFAVLIYGAAWLAFSAALFDANAEVKKEPKAAEGEGGGAGEGEGGGEGEGESESAYVDIDWFLIQAKQDDGRRRNISMLLTLELTPEADRVAVAKKFRQLRDAFLRTLNSPPLVRTARDRVDLADVKVRVIKASAKVLGPDVVGQVLIRNINDTGVR